MSLITYLHNNSADVEIISDYEYNNLDEGAQRAFRRVANNITQYYRCTSGPKKGKLASDPSKCGQRKDPAKVRHGRRVAKQKGAIRVRKTIARKRTQVSKRVTKLNRVLKSRRAGGTRKPKKLGESFIEYLINGALINESKKHRTDDSIPTRQEIIDDVVEHGPDSEWLFLIPYKDLEQLVTSGKLDEDIYMHWDNVQEDMRIMRADAAAEFGESVVETTVDMIMESIHSEGDMTKFMHDIKMATDLSTVLDGPRLDHILQTNGYSDKQIVDVAQVRYKIEGTTVSLIVTFRYKDGTEHDKHGTVYLTSDGRQWNAKL